MSQSEADRVFFTPRTADIRSTVEPLLDAVVRSNSTDPYEIADPAVDVENQVIDQMIIDECMNIIFGERSPLTEKQIQALRLSYGFDGDPMSVRQMAVVTGTSFEAAHQLRRRAIEQLRARFGISYYWTGTRFS